MRGLLDDYAYTAIACLDAYEMTGDLSYFRFAQQIADQMITRFADPTSGGFFDTEPPLEERLQLGALSARRKPFQDAPTPAGNPCAAIALLRLHAYTNESKYRDKAEDTLEVFAGVAEQFGIYAGTYGLAATWLARPHTQVIVVGEDDKAEALLQAASAPYAVNLSVVHLTDSEAVAENLPPALAETIPHLAGSEGKEVLRGGVHELHLSPAHRQIPKSSRLCCGKRSASNRHFAGMPHARNYLSATVINTPRPAIPPHARLARSSCGAPRPHGTATCNPR